MIQTDLYGFSYKKGSLLPWCKRCGEQNWWKNGKNKQGVQRYKCKNCGFRFVWTSDLPRRRNFSQVMHFAVELYTSLKKCASLSGVTEILKDAFGVIVSRETIRQWVKVCKKTVSRRKKPIATHWHADETYIKIKGVGHWLWIVFCEDRKQILSWHISKKRTYLEARKLFRNALKTARTKPSEITTDGLWEYRTSIKKIMGWSWQQYSKRHHIESGIGKNAIIERLNREIKRRIKWFSTFQSMEGANNFFHLWFYHFNLTHST